MLKERLMENLKCQIKFKVVIIIIILYWDEKSRFIVTSVILNPRV